MVDHHAIARLLLETRRLSKEDFETALRQSRESGRPPHEILLLGGKVSVDELVQAITIHVDITLLKEALGMDHDASGPLKAARPLGSYLERISLLFKMGILMSSETRMGSLLELLMREAPSVMNAERATIFLADNETRELYSHMGVGVQPYQIRIPWDSGIAGWVYTHGESLNIADPYSDPRFNKDVDPRTGFRTRNLLCVPLRTPGGSILGVFQVLNKRAGVFTALDLEILEVLASQASRAITQAIEWDHLRQSATFLKQQNVGLRQALLDKDPFEEIVGNSHAIQEVRSLVRKVAPTDTTVLLQGESGTGKELVARAIHRLSSRSDKSTLSLNCAAVPSELIESELFGHKKGAFTGAVADHQGVFASAHNATLFLDEIEATSPAMQVKLLRAIQMGEIKRVGDNTVELVDVRLLAATNRDLVSMVQQGFFREDLFYRINVFPIVIPPLRDRLEDVPVLIRHFLDKLSTQTGKLVQRIDPAALDLLMHYAWPGNIRELENEIERAHILCSEGSSISVRCLSPRVTQPLQVVTRSKDPARPPKLKEMIDELESRVIREALEICEGNRSLTSKRLGLSRQGLINKIHKYGLTKL